MKLLAQMIQESSVQVPSSLATVTMSSVSIALALVLDGIAMSAKTSTSLKKALSYRAVEILLVDNHGFQKFTLQSPPGSCADVADCQQVAEVFHDEKIPMHEKQDDYNARQDFKSKHDKEFKFKKAKAKTQETIKTAKLKMEHMKIEEQGKQDIEFFFGEVVKDSSTQTCCISDLFSSNSNQNFLAEHDKWFDDVQELIRIAWDNTKADVVIKVKAWTHDKVKKYGWWDYDVEKERQIIRER